MILIKWTYESWLWMQDGGGCYKIDAIRAMTRSQSKTFLRVRSLPSACDEVVEEKQATPM